MPHRIAKKFRRADQYNDPKHNYLRYWDKRQYEHNAEELAIRRLLKGKKFKRAVDVGGGYGRLCILLEDYADQVILAEPSKKQLGLAASYLGNHHRISRKALQADDLKFKASSVDLVIMIRVMHHLPDPAPELNEVSRILSDDGLAIIEVANYIHVRNRMKYLVKLKKLPVKPVNIRSKKNRSRDEIPFVNHNPHTVIRQLQHAGLEVVSTLSVSNLRSQRLKNVMPYNFMLSAERMAQKTLAPLYFGPSIFFLVKKMPSSGLQG